MTFRAVHVVSPVIIERDVPRLIRKVVTVFAARAQDFRFAFFWIHHLFFPTSHCENVAPGCLRMYHEQSRENTPRSKAAPSAAHNPMIRTGRVFPMLRMPA
jgi:hypothetical protein